MAQDKYSAVWVSNSSISDFLKCPRAYYLHNVYKDSQTGHKINIINPPMALGLAVHDTLEAISDLSCEDRFKKPLTLLYEEAWQKIAGIKGGFRNEEDEKMYKEKGLSMIKRIMDNPGPLLNKALKLNNPDNFIPNYWISEEENIILCGKIDWLEYMSKDDSVHIIDFKTGVNDEKPDSIQLLIYCLLVKNLQQREVKKMSFWYLNRDDKPVEVALPDFEEAHNMILDLAKQVKHLRQSGQFRCPKDGCFACNPFEAVLRGEAKFVGMSDNHDIYVLPE